MNAQNTEEVPSMDEEIKEGDSIRWRGSVCWHRGQVGKIEHDSYAVRLEGGGWMVTPKGALVQKIEPPKGGE